MTKESVRKKKFKNKKTIIFACFLTVVVAIAGVGFSTVNVNAGDTYVSWTELSELDGVEENTSKTVALNGNYKVTKDTTITATTAGMNAITINGTTQLYIAKDVTLTVKGADGEGNIGGGAGICLPSGKILRIYGEGTLVATGGDSGSATPGSAAESVKMENGTLITGAGGAGGNGAGSAGAGIGGSGVKGGTGGAGGESQTASGIAYSNGINGTNGKSGTKGNTMGTLYLYDTLTINATAGNSTQQTVLAGSNSTSLSEKIEETMSYMAFASAGGGAGGNAGTSANIGGSGSGGSGGGGGASGGYIIANEEVQITQTSDATVAESSSYAENKTVGGAGGNAGSGSYTKEEQTTVSDGGQGGSSGTATAGGAGGTVYCSSGVTLTNSLSGGDDEVGEGEKAVSYTLGMLTAKAYYYDDESKTYKEGTEGGIIASGVHEPGAIVTANTKEDSSLAEVSAEPAEGYSFAGWYSESTEPRNFLSGELNYTVDFSGIESTQTVYALFKKATQITAEANGTLTVYKGITETEQEGLSKLIIPRNTVVTIDGNRKTLKQGGVYYYKEAVTTNNGSAGLSTYPGEQLLFYAEPAENYFYSGMMIDNEYTSAQEFCQYAFVTVEKEFPKTYTSLFSAAKTLVLNFEGGVAVNYNEPIQFDTADMEYQLPQSIRIGHNFLGWQLNSENARTDMYIPAGSIVRYKEDSENKNNMQLAVYTYDENGVETCVYTAPAEEGIIFSAKWDKNTYPITLIMPEGATITYFEGVNTVPEGFTYTYDENENAVIMLPTAEDMTYEGYDFLGWYLYEDFSGNSVTEFSSHATSGPTFYAKWGKQFQAILTLEGAPIVGQTLQAKSVSEDNEITFTYAWYRDGVQIAGEHTASYTLRSEDVGCVIKCIATGSETYTPNISISCSTEKISNKTGNTLTGVEVSGIAQNGKTLKAFILPQTAENVTYQWYRLMPNPDESGTVVETKIEGATSSTYTLTNEDVGHALKCIAMDSYENAYSFITPVISDTTEVKLVVTEQTQAACGSGAVIKVDTQDMTANSYITITIPEGLELTKYPDKNDRTIGAFITSVEKEINEEDGTVTLTYYFEKKTNVLGFSITVEPDYTNTHGSVKRIQTTYTNANNVSIIGETAIYITNATAQPGSGYICPVTDNEVYYQVRENIFHIYHPALFVNTTVTSAHPSYQEVSMVVPISSSKYIPIPVFYDEDKGTYIELADGQTYQMTDGDEAYTVTYYENYAVKNGGDVSAAYTGSVLVYTLPEKSGICSGESSEYRFNGEYTDGSKLALRFDQPIPGEYFPMYKEQINIKDASGAKTTVYNTASRSNYTSLDIIFYEEGTDSLHLETDITSLGYSHMVENILVPYQYSNRYAAYLTYYSKENLITDMKIHYNLEEQQDGGSKLGCNEVTFCYPNTLKAGTTYQAIITYEDGSKQTTSVYNSKQTFKSTNGKQIIAVDVHYQNDVENGGILRGASAELFYCNIYNEQNLEPDNQAEADGYITAEITEITYVGEASNGQVVVKENVESDSSAYNFQHTDTFTPAGPTINPSTIEIGDSITIQYTFGNSTNPGATYSPQAYMIMPKGYIYQAGSYQKNANSSYKASYVESEDISNLYTTDGLLPNTNTLLETGYATDGTVMYRIYGRSMEIGGSYYNAYSILYEDTTIRSGYKTLGMDFMVSDYISLPSGDSKQITLPYAIYFDNGENVYQTEHNSAFIASYEKENQTYYISEQSVGYDINGDGDTGDSFAKPSAMPQAALNVSYVMVIDGATDKAFYKVNETGHYTAVIFNRTSDNTGHAEITIDLARNTDAGSEFNMILLGSVTLEGGDIQDLEENVQYGIPDGNGTLQYYTKDQIESGNNLSYEAVTQLKIICDNLTTGNLNTISFDFVSKNIVTGQDEIAGAYVPTSVSYSNSSTGTGSESYKTTVPCEIEAARLELTGISMEESISDKGTDIYYVGDTLSAVHPMSELSTINEDENATFTYQWYRDGKPITGETNQKYELTNADYGHTIYCMITGTGDYYSSVKTPVVNKIAVDLVEETPFDDNISISGKTVLNNKAADRTLTANLNTDTYPSNVAVTYQWYRSQVGTDGEIEWIPISGATSKTYTLTNEDWGKQFTVKAFGKEGEYAYVETGYSNPTAPITSRRTYVYIKQDGKASPAKGDITLVNTTDETLVYALDKASDSTYYFDNIQPGVYKVLTEDKGYPNEKDTGLTVSVGAGISSQSTTINYYSIQYELIDATADIDGEEVVDYPIYYRKNQGVELPTEVSLTNDEFLGWYLDDHYTSEKQTAVKGIENKAMTYYAKWKYTHPIFYQLKNVTASNMQNTIWENTTYSTTLTANNEYYEITENTIVVKVDGKALNSGQYTYTETTGELQILSEHVTGVIDIEVFAEPRTFLLTRDLEHITSNKSDVKEIKYGTNYTETLTVDAGYTTPSEITVMRGTEILDPSNYTVTMSGRNIKVTIPGTEVTDEIEIIAKAVKVGAKSHTLTIQYVDTDGKPLEDVETVVKTLAEGDSYSVDSPSVEGYVPDLSRVSGTMDTVDVTVTVVYRPTSEAELPEDSTQDEQTGEDDNWVPDKEENDTEENYKDATTNILVTVKHQDEGTFVEGITTYAYQILSIQSGNKEGYVYTINSYYQEFFNKLLEKEKASDKDVLDYLETLNTNEQINEFLKTIQAYTLEKKVSYVDKETGAIGSTQFTLDCSRRYSADDSYYAGMGYYFFVSEGTLGDQMTLSLVTRDMTVYIKSQEVTLEKEVEKSDYPMNSNTIQYTITIPVPNMANVPNGYTYKVHDSIDNGITMDSNSLKVYVYERFQEENMMELMASDGEQEGYDYQVEYGKKEGKDALTITFNFDSGSKLSGNQQNGKLIKIVYTAFLNENAVLGGEGNANIAYLEYSRNPYSDITLLDQTEEEKETVYTYGIDIVKKSGALFSAPVLEGAEFTIRELRNSGAELLSFEKKNGVYYKSDEGNIETTVVTDADGMLRLYGLDAGIYMIEETKAPEGYQTIDKFYLEICAEYDEEGILKSFSGNLTDTKGFVNITKTSKEDGKLFLKIVDPTEGANELPATGGVGRMIVYCLGGTLMASAILLLTLRAKKKEDANEK